MYLSCSCASHGHEHIYRREWNWPFTSNGQSEEAPPWRNGWRTSNQNLTIWWLSEPMNRVNQSNSLSHHSSFLFIVSHDKHCTSQYTTHFHEKLNESAKQIKILQSTAPTPEKFECGFSTNRSLSHNLLITCKTPHNPKRYPKCNSLLISSFTSFSKTRPLKTVCHAHYQDTSFTSSQNWWSKAKSKKLHHSHYQVSTKTKGEKCEILHVYKCQWE